MGYNTTIVIMNDALSSIRDDPEFGRRLYEAIIRNDLPAHVSTRDGTFTQTAAVVVESHHADDYVLVKVGGNKGAVVARATGVTPSVDLKPVFAAALKRQYKET